MVVRGGTRSPRSETQAASSEAPVWMYLFSPLSLYARAGGAAACGAPGSWRVCGSEATARLCSVSSSLITRVDPVHPHERARGV
eukprot:5740003-Prymnesium_polylepis.1